MKHLNSTAVEEYDRCIPVRVWIGYALPKLRSGSDRGLFYEKLGKIFIPATVQIMQPLGLTAYLPSILPADQNLHIPDEVALVFYPNCQSYEHAKSDSTGGRAYQLLHATVFNFVADKSTPESHSAFPLPFDRNKILVSTDGSYSLFSNPTNWQSGMPVVLVVSNDSSEPKTVVRLIVQRMFELQAEPPTGLDGLIFYICDSFVVVWSHWQTTPTEMNVLKDIDGLRVVLNRQYTQTSLPMPVTTEFDGLEVSPGDSYNFQFPIF